MDLVFRFEIFVLELGEILISWGRLGWRDCMTSSLHGVSGEGDKVQLHVVELVLQVRKVYLITCSDSFYTVITFLKGNISIFRSLTVQKYIIYVLFNILKFLKKWNLLIFNQIETVESFLTWWNEINLKIQDLRKLSTVCLQKMWWWKYDKFNKFSLGCF